MSTMRRWRHVSFSFAWYTVAYAWNNYSSHNDRTHADGEVRRAARAENCQPSMIHAVYYWLGIELFVMASLHACMYVCMYAYMHK